MKALKTAIRQLRGELGARAGKNGSGEGIPTIGTVPGVGLEYSRKLRELKTQEVLFEQLTQQYETAKLNEAKDSSSFQILDEAVVPLGKSGPSRSLIVTLAAVAAFIISIVTVIAQESLAKASSEDRKIIEDIKKQALILK